MRNIIIIILAFLTFAITSCSEQDKAKQMGGTTTINLEPNKRLVEATWKDGNIWYLVEPMDNDYTPKTKEFIESSSWGVWEGKVIFVESKN